MSVLLIILSMKKITLVSVLLLISTCLFAFPFNKNLQQEELEKLQTGELFIKNINIPKNMCLSEGYSNLSDKLIKETKAYSPKYLAEVIQIKPIKGNEDLDKKLDVLLNNVSAYAGIPYYSVQAEAWYDLYSSAEILETIEMNDGGKKIKAVLQMAPFDTVYEDIDYYAERSNILYMATNTNKLRYLDKFDCIWPEKMKICILLLRDDENWILYGLGGANVPRLPFFTERIQRSLINRINTFCKYIFEQL